MTTVEPKQKITTLLSLILAGEVIFFLPFVLARIFRPVLLRVFEITNLELGACFSVYGIVAMIAYFFGGPLADRYPSRNLMAIALWATGLGGLFLALIPSPFELKFLYGFWGLTTIFLFWAALIRATRDWGGEGFQGRAFGWLEGGRGLAAALLGTLALGIFSAVAGESESGTKSFQLVILVTALIVLVTGGVVWFGVPAKITKLERTDTQTTLKNVGKLMRRPSIWMQSIIIVCAYVGYKITDDFSLYANEVLGFNEVESAGVGLAAIWMRPVFAVIAGLMADRLSGSKVLIACFAFMSIGALGLTLGAPASLAWVALILMTASLVGIYGLRGVYFAVMQEAKIPPLATGTAVGILSVVGYTPDVFMSPLMGYLLDSNPGITGHQHVFMVLLGFAMLGFVTSLLFRREVSLPQA